jgi:hypothetical protein
MSGYSNVSGNFFDFSLPPSPFSTNTTTPSSTAGSTTTTDTTPRTGFTLDKGLNIITQGLNAFLTLDTNKTNRALADASVKTSQSGGGGLVSQDTYRDTEKSNTTLYVVLALVGVLVVGGGILYAVRSKNS